MGNFIKLINQMGIRRKYIFLLLLRSPFDAARTWMLANLMKSIFHCLETGHADLLLKICVAYGLAGSMLFLYNGIIWSRYAAFCAKMEAWLQKKIFERILSLSFKQVDRCSGGEWITKLNSDIQGAFIMMNGPMNLPHLAAAVLNTMLSSFLMFRSSRMLLGVVYIFIVLQLFTNYKIVLGKIPKLKEEAQSSMAENTSAIKPLITDADTILLYDAAALMLKNCEENSKKLMKSNMKIHVRNALSDGCMRLSGIGGYLAVLLMGYRFISEGIMAFSDLVYCFQVRGAMIAGMLMLITCLNNLKMNSVCIRRIHDVLEEKEVYER